MEFHMFLSKKLTLSLLSISFLSMCAALNAAQVFFIIVPANKSIEITNIESEIRKIDTTLGKAIQWRIKIPSNKTRLIARADINTGNLTLDQSAFDKFIADLRIKIQAIDGTGKVDGINIRFR